MKLIVGLGEKYFMESFVDGDLAANNGGWQWTASVSLFLSLSYYADDPDWD